MVLVVWRRTDNWGAGKLMIKSILRQGQRVIGLR